MRKIAVFPSLVTIANLVCGFAAVAALIDPGKHFAVFGRGELAAAWFIMLGMVFDMFDGKLARLAKATSDFGGQLDSLSDCVTFGLAPGMLIVSISTLRYKEAVWLLAALYSVCAALRLARFNVEHSSAGHKQDYFKGLPSPAAAGLLASMVIFDLYSSDGTPLRALHTGVILPFAGLAAGLLMVSRVRYPHLMKWIFKGKKQFGDFVRLVVLCACIFRWPQYAFVVLFSAYTVSGVVLTTRAMITARARGQRYVYPPADGEGTPHPDEKPV
jgi:CDP-diacylglycerol--serine O-phosphatidyltransferase